MAKRTLRTRLCDMLDIEYPILSAGMGPSLIGEATGAPVELVVAVSEAGGLGVLGGAGYTVEQMREEIREIKKLTSRPFGVDVLLPAATVAAGDAPAESAREIPLIDALGALPPAHREWMMKIKDELGLPETDAVISGGTTTSRPHAAVEACIEEQVPLFCAGLGSPGFMVEAAHGVGMKVLGIAGNVRNARRIAESGADLVVAQGHEAGGHTGRIGSIALWPQAIDAVAPTPVLAAGGIGDGRGLAAALAMGCAGVWVGTRFLASEEGGALPIQKQAIVNASEEDTRRTTIYTGKTSRATYNRFHDLWEESGLEPLRFPTQVVLASAVVDMFNRAGNVEYVGPFAGQVSGLIREIKPAASILEEMVEEAADILTHRLPETVSVS
ncbi:MAG: nitronate monooxygenase [Deltaproteobacteria bacterium]|nr:nitronate monooxygenase [Deltaproteobacteria bacterium]MBW2387981.1 nitronate monooxygenase [Deltaproteobacteria bacterium]